MEGFMSAFTVKSPLNSQELYTVSEPELADLKKTFQIARQSADLLATTSANERCQEVEKLISYITKNKEAIITKIVQETGKSRTDALASEIFPTLDALNYLKKEGAEILSDKAIPTPLVLMGKKSKVFYEPLGVILVISPWNYPFYQALVPSISAFVAGNAVIYKPSEITPLKGLIEEIIEKSGFRKEAIQIVYGGKETGRSLIDLRPDKIFFTGSTRAGKEIMNQAAKYLIPLDLELGGKDPLIVFNDVNLERTINGALWGALTNAGQSCTSVERIYVQEEIYAKFVSKTEEKIKQLKPAEKVASDKGDIDIGFMTAEFQIKIIEEQLQDAVEKGARILVGGKRENGSLFFPPTLVVNVNHQMRIVHEETFGPVMVIMKFQTEEEVIRLANESEYGLSASVWSKDLARAERVSRKLKVGNVSINNVMLTEGNPALPFGGVKNSGFGRYKGEYGLYSFTNVKSIIVDSQSAKLEANWFPYTKEKYERFSELIDSMFSGKGKLLKTIISGLKLENSANKEKL